MTLEQVYAEMFAIFCQYTNEKEVFLNRLKKILEKIPNCSMLDIGAGNGELAIPLSGMVQRYRAVESNPDHCQILRKAGLEVIESAFPCAVMGEEYNVVLISHSLPTNRAERERFVRHAYNLVRIGGVLVILTFKDQGTDWSILLDECGMSWEPMYEGGLNLFKDGLALMNEGGKNRVEHLKTYVTDKEPAEIAKALAFVYSNGDQERLQEFLRNTKVLEILRARYSNEKKKVYAFPFEHVLYTVNK